jgi:RNA polymerase sigma-70 factor (ECF subfamily)
MTAMADGDASSIQTRPSFLNRLKAGDDAEGWCEFYRVYGKLIHNFALNAGLNETEADEVVQETAIALSKHLPEFRYDPKVCRFKTWLLNQTSWRIKDQFKKRAKLGQASGQLKARKTSASISEDSTCSDVMNRLPDPASINLDTLFESEWKRSLLTVALERVKDKFTLKQFQIFDLLVYKEWPASDVAESLSVSLANVYVTKHRISAALKKETVRLQKEMERTIPLPPSAEHRPGDA